MSAVRVAGAGSLLRYEIPPETGVSHARSSVPQIVPQVASLVPFAPLPNLQTLSYRIRLANKRFHSFDQKNLS